MTLQILKFSAHWCQPCKKYDPILTKVMERNKDVVLRKIDIEEEFELTASYGVQSVPYTIFQDENENVFGGTAGIIPEAQLQSLIDTYKEAI